MSETREPTIEPTGAGAQTERRWSSEDILKAEDPKAVMEAYYNATKFSRDRGGLMLSVGERLTQLGDVEHAMQFTIAGEQARSADMMRSTMEQFDQSTTRFDSANQSFENNNRLFSRSVGSFEENMGQFNNSARRLEELPQSLNRSASVFSEVSEQIGRSVGRMSDAAQQINTASYRMSR